MILYLNFLPLILFWSVKSYLKKALYKHINNYEYLLYINLIYSIIFLAFFAYYINPTQFLNKLRVAPSIIYVKAFAVCLFFLMATFALYNLIKMYNVNYIIPVARGASQLLILLIGYYFYKENITTCTIIGTILILYGIYLI
jgi:uncharacterized membrane protein